MKEPLQPLIPLDSLKEVVQRLLRVPKAAIAPPDAEKRQSKKAQEKPD